MNLTEVMEEIADKLKLLTGLNVFDFPTDSITPPAGILSYPDRVDYDTAVGNAEMQFVNLPVWLVTDRIDSKSARIQASKWLDPTGNESVKKFLDRENYNFCDDVQVVGATFDTVDIAGISYLAVLFELNVSGEQGE